MQIVAELVVLDSNSLGYPRRPRGIKDIDQIVRSHLIDRICSALLGNQVTVCVQANDRVSDVR